MLKILVSKSLQTSKIIVPSHIKVLQRSIIASSTTRDAKDVTNNGQLQEEGIKLSESCIERLKQISTPNEPFLRIGVEGGGCSGFQYKFDLASTKNDDDKIFGNNGAKIIVDETSLEYLKGSTIDFQKELIRSAFRILRNPRAEHGCSCGASFSVKID